MKLTLDIRLVAAGYGSTCKKCRAVGHTTLLQVLQQDRVIAETNLCPRCIDTDTVVEVEVSVSDPPRGTRAYGVESRRLEQVAARDLRASVQPGSGCSLSASFKGDIRKQGKWLFEHKFTNSVKGFMLKLEDMAKVIRQTDATEHPAMIVEFRKIGERLVVVPFGTFQEKILDANENQ